MILTELARQRERSRQRVVEGRKGDLDRKMERQKYRTGLVRGFFCLSIFLS